MLKEKGFVSEASKICFGSFSVQCMCSEETFLLEMADVGVLTVLPAVPGHQAFERSSTSLVVSVVKKKKKRR